MSNSPAPFPSPSAIRTPVHNGYDDDEAAGQLRTGSGPSRQARRLQLRNAGFRGTAVPTRKVTPQSPASSNWSTIGGNDAWSSNENVPRSTASPSLSARRQRPSSGIFRDLSNSAALRPARARQRVTSRKFSDSDSHGERSPVQRVPSKGTIRPRAAKTRAKFSQTRRSLSAETSKYIEHLESELATTQSQLSKISSPTVTRQQTSKLRNMDAETRQLQQQVEDWEAKYEERVQEEVDRHYAIETSLRGRIRGLEQDVDESRFRIQDLEAQITTTAQNMEAVEAANVNLERRLEIMSEILATCPSKIDLHAETPGRGRKHVRPKSMLPRFPTASSLLGSPERQSQTQPTSPLLTFTNYSPEVPWSPAQSIRRLDGASEQSDYMSEAESVFSEASGTGDSMTSAENFEIPPSFNPWNMPPPQHTRTKPARRMRKFGAGSFGPKPLILPSTSACDQLPPTSAPPLERSETMPTFFSEQMDSSHDSPSPLLGRRRASTMANGEKLEALLSSPFSDVPPPDVGDVTLMDLNISSPECSRPPTRDMSSLGQAAGRTLMDELTAASPDDSGISSDLIFESSRPATRDDDQPSLSRSDRSPYDGTAEETHTPKCQSTSLGGEAILSAGNQQASRKAQHPSVSAMHTASVLERVRFLFGDLWRSPLGLVRHLIHTVQGRMRVPRPLRDVQWWLVGALLGPMARRRMLYSQPDLCERGEYQSLFAEDNGEHGGHEDDRLAYGTLYESPAPSSKPITDVNASRSLKNRTKHKVRCPHHRAKHSPLLWAKFSITLAFAIGTAFKDGPGSLLKSRICPCQLERAVSVPRIDREGEESLI